MKKLLSVFLLLTVSLNLFSADSITYPRYTDNKFFLEKQNTLTDNASKDWNAQVVYTTDGNGNVIPIGSSAVTVSGSGQKVSSESLSVVLSSDSTATKIPSLTVVSGSGTVASGAYEVSFLVAGTADVTVLSSTLSQGESVTYTAPVGTTLGAITYAATGSTLKISEVR